MRSVFRRPALAGIMLIGLAAVAQAQPTPARPVVIELFTSQGCSSCPPADALLSELAERPDVLPLAFHVTYWNRLGWRDPFSLDTATDRQRAYQRLLGDDTVYTPQMIVDGRVDVIGSDRAGVARAIAQARGAAVVPIGLSRTAQGLRIQVAATSGAAARDAQLLLIGYDSQHRTAVARGENAGRQLSESNIVRSFSTLTTWSGQTLDLASSAPTAERAAVILQARDGRILGAAVLPRNSGVSG